MLWNTWRDKETGEAIESHTVLTVNADTHPLMGRMHRPDPKRPPEMQDKRSVVPIGPEDVDLGLTGSMAQAAELVRLWRPSAPSTGRRQRLDQPASGGVFAWTSAPAAGSAQRGFPALF